MASQKQSSRQVQPLAVDVQRVSKSFVSGTETIHALKQVSLEIRKGEVFGLLGPNGAGKTTLISIMVGLTTADAGKVSICGLDVQHDLHEVQQSINMVRGFGGVLDRMDCVELMRFYAMLYNVPNPGARIEELLKRVGLWERRHQYVNLMSTGWRQRFFIAKALLNEPKVLLLDEPTVGLDVDMAINVRQLVRELHEQGYTILLTTHYMKEAEELCDRIALISGGRIAAQGTPKELKALVKKDEAITIKGHIDEGVRTRLQTIPGVLGMARHADMTRLLVTEHKVMKRVLAELGKASTHVDSVSRDEPTLEDVFLKLTKQGLGSDDANGGDAK